MPSLSQIFSPSKSPYSLDNGLSTIFLSSVVTLLFAGFIETLFLIAIAITLLF